MQYIISSNSPNEGVCICTLSMSCVSTVLPNLSEWSLSIYVDEARKFI